MESTAAPTSRSCLARSAKAASCGRPGNSAASARRSYWRLSGCSTLCAMRRTIVCQALSCTPLAPPPMPVGSASVVSMPPVPARTSCFCSHSRRVWNGCTPRTSESVFTSLPLGRAPLAASAAATASSRYFASSPSGMFGGITMNTPGTP